MANQPQASDQLVPTWNPCAILSPPDRSYEAASAKIDQNLVQVNRQSNRPVTGSRRLLHQKSGRKFQKRTDWW